MIGSVCSVSYCSVYLCKNLLGAVAPHITAQGAFTTDQIGTLSSTYFITYAVGQLINGMIGDKIRGKYMVSLGLLLASICFFLLPSTLNYSCAPYIIYGMAGFFLAMIYAPMVKTVAENTLPEHATRCGVANTLGSYLGSPLAGVMAATLSWQGVFTVSSGIMAFMGIVFFSAMTLYERRGIVKYDQFRAKKDTGDSIRVLLQRRIIKFTFIAMLTGIVRTTVIFWLPTYISQHLGFPPEQASLIYTGATLVTASSAFAALFVYERLKRNMDLTILIMFTCSAASFLAVYFLRQPVANILFMVLAILSSNAASSMLWSRYCPSLRDTGMVSSATGFLDFSSYMAASLSSKLFAGAVGSIGWGNLILVWFILMCSGIAVAIPRKTPNKSTI